jgi:hypothetical protein
MPHLECLFLHIFLLRRRAKQSRIPVHLSLYVSNIVARCPFYSITYKLKCTIVLYCIVLYIVQGYLMSKNAYKNEIPFHVSVFT